MFEILEQRMRDTRGRNSVALMGSRRPQLVSAWLIACQTIVLIIGLMLIVVGQSQAAPHATSHHDNKTRVDGTGERPELELGGEQNVSHSMKQHSQYELVRKICNNNKVDIPDISLMRNIVTIVQLDNRSCKERYDSSILALYPILGLNVEQLCSDDSIELLKAYHFKFIQPLRHLNILPTRDEPVPQGVYKAQLHPEPRKYTADYEDQNILMTPIAIRHFFLKFALQVSFTCKRNLVANLVEEDKLQLNEEDRALLSKFGDDSPIGQAFSPEEAVDFDNVMFILELDGPGSKLNPERREKYDFIKVHLGVDSDSFKMIAGCRNKFAPIYNKLFLPIIKLSKMGYDYRGDKFNDFEKLRLNKGQIRTWLSIIHVCELFRGVKLYDGSGYVIPTTIEDTTTTKPAGAQANESTKTTTETAGSINLGAKVSGDKIVSSDKNNARVELESSGVKLDLISQQEAERLQSKLKIIDLMRPNHFQVTVFSPLEQTLMITSEKQLDYELSLKPGHKNPFGFKGFMRNTGNLIKKAFSKLDMERFAHYRRHSVYYTGLLNFLSALSNVASITATIIGIVGMPAG